MEKNLDTAKLFKGLFKNNWKENFLFDGLNNREFSYEDFFKEILNCKEKLDSIGFKKNDSVCLLMSNSFELLVLYFASLTMGLVVVPVDIKKGEDEIKEIISKVKCKAIISDSQDFDFSSRIIKIKEFSKYFYKKREVSIQDLSVFDNLDYDKTFLIAFTSGSTGVPKGVMHSFNNLVSSAVAFKKRFNFGKENIFYHNLPMTYMAGILNLIFLPFISGSKIVIGERFDVSNLMRFWDLPIKYSANTFWFIPTVINLLLKIDRGNEGIDYASKSKIIGCIGTAPLNEAVKKAFQQKYQIPLYESYGLSETLFVTTNSPGRPEIENSAGEKLEGVKLDFEKDNEVIISVPWMFLGYLNAGTDDYFKKGKFQSGDLGMVDEGGFLKISGRKKDLIIRGGINIAPKKIEDLIIALDIFEESVILGLEDRVLGEKIVCFFVSEKGMPDEDKKKKLNYEIIKKLGRHCQIDEFVKMHEIPKTSNGKTDKPKIKKIYDYKN